MALETRNCFKSESTEKCWLVSATQARVLICQRLNKAETDASDAASAIFTIRPQLDTQTTQTEVTFSYWW